MTTTEIFKCYKKNPVLWSIKIPINCTLFDAQNAGNRISKLPDFKFFWRGWGACPFSGHSSLLHLPWPLITNVVETPDDGVDEREPTPLSQNCIQESGRN